MTTSCYLRQVLSKNDVSSGETSIKCLIDGVNVTLSRVDNEQSFKKLWDFNLTSITVSRYESGPKALINIFVSPVSNVEIEVDSLDDGYWYWLGEEETSPIAIRDRVLVKNWNQKRDQNFKIKFDSIKHRFEYLSDDMIESMNIKFSPNKYKY